jgi:hypothetical protein
VTRAELHTYCRFVGIYLFAEPGGELGWEADGDPSHELLADLKAHKAQILTLLPPPWDQAEADRVLAELHAEVEKLKAGFGKKLPTPLARMLDDAVVIGQRYIRDHELEARRGWDAMELLRDLLPHVRTIVANWKKQHQA